MAWGVYPIVMDISLPFKETAAKACLMLKEMQFAASGDKIVMDADTAAFLTSPEHLEQMLERMGQPELAAWMKQQDLAADALQFEDRKKILPLKEAA